MLRNVVADFPKPLDFISCPIVQVPDKWVSSKLIRPTFYSSIFLRRDAPSTRYWEHFHTNIRKPSSHSHY